jgi:hypothetical protein
MDTCITFTIAEYPRDEVNVLIYPLNGGYLCREPNSELYFYLRKGHLENWELIIQEFLSRHHQRSESNTVPTRRRRITGASAPRKGGDEHVHL